MHETQKPSPAVSGPAKADRAVILSSAPPGRYRACKAEALHRDREQKPMKTTTEAKERPGTGPVQDRQTVTPKGERIEPRIAGVVIRPAVTHVDDRGELCEIYNPAWEIHPEPMVYAYQSMVRPGKVKGWIVHHLQDDRLFVSLGTLRIVLYDARDGSPTQGKINEIFLGERNRAMIIIPRGVYHAVQNVSSADAWFINLPTRAYDHANPDKYRLPLDTDLIPYRFDESLGY